jgi:magnesium-protoporphyrin IX monomethyl ester (oxidative) cyclase
MKIALVHPAGSNWMPGKKDMTATANRMAPLGLLSIAAHLGKQGHEVLIHDCLGPRAPRGTESNARVILDFQPDIVGFSATTSGFLDGYDLATCLKRANPGLRTVFGGVHISAMGAPLLEGFEQIDFLCLGEGELTLGELAAGKDPDQIHGLVRRNQGRAMSAPPRTPILELDDLPFPAYEKLQGFPDGYRLPLFSYIQTPGATMITSRGCPYQCTFCDRSVFGRSYRFNSAAYVYEHMKYLRTRFGVRHINIYDDLFTTHRQRIVELCGLLASRPLGLHLNCAVRVGHTDDELLTLLKQAGFLQLSLGIETGDEALIKTHKPGVDLEEIRDTVRRIQAKGLRAKGLFMMGLPGETEASIRKTSDFVLSLGLDDMNMSKFTPFPGAPVWSTILEEGTFDNDWKKMNCLNFVFVPKGIESREKLDQLYNQHVKRFYSDPAWRRKFRKRFWQHRKSMGYFLSHLPSFLGAMRNFEPEPVGEKAGERT